MPFPSSKVTIERKKVKSLSRVQLFDPMDCSPPGSSIHGSFQARVLERVAIAFFVAWVNIFKNRVMGEIEERWLFGEEI